jgi:Flp pilus assembly protein CpaB
MGALLVAAAAVATFAAYLEATAAPTATYVVAREPVEVGTRLASMDELGALFGTIALDLTGVVAERLIREEELSALIGQAIVSPLQAGDPLTRTQLLDDGGLEDGHSLSFALPRPAAVAGELRPGERIDVLATYGEGKEAYTTYVVRGVPLARVAAPDGGALGSSADLTLTIVVPGTAEVQAVGHAVHSGDVFIARSTVGSEGVTAIPDDFRPAPASSTPGGHAERDAP